MSTQGKDSSGSAFDHIMTVHELKNDAALARFLSFGPPVISKIRRGRLDISAEVLLRMHERTGIAVSEFRAMMPKPPKTTRG